MELESLVVPQADAAEEAGKLILDLPMLWTKADQVERRKLLIAMLDAVYVDAKKMKSIVAIKPKPPFRPIFRVAATHVASKIYIINEPFQDSSVFLVETGESRTPPLVIDLDRLLPELLDRLIALGEMASQISHALGGNGHHPKEAVKLIQELRQRR